MKKPETNKRKKHDYRLVMIAVDSETGVKQEMHPRDLPREKQIGIQDRIAAAMGYERVSDAHPPPEGRVG